MRLRPIKKFEDSRDRFAIEKEWMPHEAGAIAIEMATRWGMVAVTQDGEDSSGRQQLRLLTPEELVERAINTAVILVDRMRQQGLIVDIPKDENQNTDQG